MTVEAAGGISPEPIFAIFRDIQLVFSTLSRQCVAANGIGGFSTLGLGDLTDWLNNPSTNSQIVGTPTADSLNGIPPNARFLTVTVSGSSLKFAPGDTDPVTAIALAELNDLAASRLNLPSGGLGGVNTFTSASWETAAERMERGGSMPWWQAVSLHTLDEMKYECDANLGSPPIVDCAQIEWSQLGTGGSSSDTLTVGPDVMFLHSKTCFLAVSAAVTTTLSWEQFRVAVETLMNICVQHPYNAPQGGRAYFEPQRKGVSGRKEKRQNSKLSVSGTNALPPKVIIRMFQQLESWKSAANELKTCTWRAVLDGRLTTTCPAG